MDLKRNNRLSTRFFILFLLLIAAGILLTGCVRGMTPVGWSGVAESDGVLYTGSKEGRVVSIDTATLSKKFSQPITVTTSGGFGCGTSTSAAAIYGTPALAQGLVFVAGYNGEIDAYTAENLEYRWSYPPKGQKNLKPIIGSIVISGDQLYFGSTDGNVYGLDIATGNERWRFETGGEIWSTPAIENGSLYIGSFDRKIYAIDIATSSKKWEFPTGATNVAPPTVADGLVYAGSLDLSIYALNEDDGSKVWQFTAGSWFWAKPVVFNDVVYAPNLDDHVYGLDARTGEKLFEYDLGGQISSWPVVVGSEVIAATEDGKIFALGTDRNNPGQRQIAELPDKAVVNSPLSEINGFLYVNASDNQIYQVNINTGQISATVPLVAQ